MVSKGTCALPVMMNGFKTCNGGGGASTHGNEVNKEQCTHVSTEQKLAGSCEAALASVDSVFPRPLAEAAAVLAWYTDATLRSVASSPVTMLGVDPFWTSV